MIKMLETRLASANNNGILIKEYKKNEIYDVFTELKNIFLKEGWAIELEQQDNKKEIELETQDNQIEVKEIELETQDVKKQNAKKQNIKKQNANN